MKKADQLEIGFVGGGNMAQALVRGLLAAGGDPGRITVAEPLAARRRQLARRFGIKVTRFNATVAEKAQLLVLAVKPQVIDTVLEELAAVVGDRCVVVSIAAGIGLAHLQSRLGPKAKLIRVMPNTPCLLGRGMSVLCGGKRARPADLGAAHRLFSTVGQAVTVADEDLMDAVTGLSGSGPAYVYLFAEALIEGGIDTGLDPDLAEKLALETLAGASAMLLGAGHPPAELRAAVSSPGGTTLAGLARLEQGCFRETVAAAVGAATRRCRELGRK